MGSIRETRFETTDESFTLAMLDAGGEPRELHLAAEKDGGLRVTVFHGTEHTLIPLADEHARQVALWLTEQFGLPPGWNYQGGRLSRA